MIGFPREVAERLRGPRSRVREVIAEPLSGSGGAATARVELLTVTIEDDRGHATTQNVVRKTLQPVREGRHADAARSASHWASWKRELLAYRSGLLPIGPGLAAPVLLGVDRRSLYFRAVVGEVADPSSAAFDLGSWQAATPIPRRRWLARDQLAQRIAVTELDWRSVDAHPRWERIWLRREELLGRCRRAPFTVVHGDFSIDNLLTTAPDTTVALDWAAFGVGPVGADLVALTLSTLSDQLGSYLEGLGGRYASAVVESAYRAALQLTAASRVHWMLTRGTEPPPEYSDVVPDD